MVSTDQQNKIFDKAAKLIQNGWCQNTGARNAQGDVTHRLHTSAVCFCLTAALEVSIILVLYPSWRFTDDIPSVNYYYFPLLKRVTDVIGINTDLRTMTNVVAQWNDDTCRTKEEVLEVLKKAKYD